MTADSSDSRGPSVAGPAAGTASHAAPQTGGVRFAPSPTGRFHVGNLRTAWMSYRLAAARSLPWVVRFEDIDQPRVLAGARELQLQDMAALGLVPDVELLQSTFATRHRALFDLARSTGAIYACTCSRREVQMAIASAPHDGVAPVYSGHCRRAAPETAASVAWRFKMPNALGHDDFIVARTTGDEFTPAYHWACAIDDFDGRYDLIVRSSDLKHALDLQRAIHAWIARAENKPAYDMRAIHTSLVTQDDGHRLEKRTHGVTLPELLAQGWSVEKLIAAFEMSAEPQNKNADSDEPASLKISDLLK